MTAPAIQAALEKAGEAVRVAIVRPGCCMEGTGCELPPCHCASVAASAAIVAFLRALEDTAMLCPYTCEPTSLHELAAAVEHTREANPTIRQPPHA